MKSCLAVLAAITVFMLTAAPMGGSTSSGGGSRGGSSSSSSSGGGGSRSGGYTTASSSRPSGVTTYGGGKPPAPGSKVVVTQGNNGTKTTTVPPPQRAGARPGVTTFSNPKSYRTGTPYSPSGYTTANGRPTAYSPVTHSYVEVHHYAYSDWGVLGWHPYYGYYGCLYCWSGPYSYAPVPLPYAPASLTQPSWAYDIEALFFVILLFGGLIWLCVRWGGRRERKHYEYRRTYSSW